MARKILLLLALCMSDSAGTANRRLSFCTVIYGNGAQGVLRAWESWCHKVVSERLGERCPVVCVYANDKTKASAAENTHTHRGTHTEAHTQRTHTHRGTHTHAHRGTHMFMHIQDTQFPSFPPAPLSLHLQLLCPPSPRAPPHCLMQLFSPDRSDQSFLLTSDSI